MLRDFPSCIRTGAKMKMNAVATHPLLWAAIKQRRIIRCAYHGKDHLVEPYDHGILTGSVQLLGYQIALEWQPLPSGS